MVWAADFSRTSKSKAQGFSYSDRTRSTSYNILPFQVPQGVTTAFLGAMSTWEGNGTGSDCRISGLAIAFPCKDGTLHGVIGLVFFIVSSMLSLK
jgi:hypothetical protein